MPESRSFGRSVLNIYQVDADWAYGLLPTVEEAGLDDLCRESAGKPIAGNWRIPTLLVEPDSDFVPVDCICSSMPPGRLLLNRRAREFLGGLPLSCGEFLPVRLGNFDYQWFECTVKVDAVDQERTVGIRWEGLPGYWMEITRRAFKPESLARPPVIFGLPRSRARPLCTDVRKSGVERADLPGLRIPVAMVVGNRRGDDPAWSTAGVRRGGTRSR